MPKDHPDRQFLEEEDRRVRNRLSTPEEENEVAEAKRKIQELVNSDIERNGPLSTSALRENMRLSMYKNNYYGTEFLGNLLPVHSRQFGSIVRLLGRQKIETRSELVSVDLNELRQVGNLRAGFILAMRNLAIAEMNQASQKQ